MSSHSFPIRHDEMEESGWGNAVIRQAISCDICGSEKRQTNHWFVAHDSNGELRVTGWDSRNRLRPGSKHLCGQTCLHKLLDEFMARTLAVKVQSGVAEEAAVPQFQIQVQPQIQPQPQLQPRTDTSLTANVAYEGRSYESEPYEEEESTARLLTPEEALLAKQAAAAAPAPIPVAAPPVSPRPIVAAPARVAAELVAMPARTAAEELPLAEEAPRYTSRNWRAEAWDRERERELRAVGRMPGVNSRRRSGS